MKEKLRKFMLNRSGMDKLNSLLFTLCAICVLYSVAAELWLNGRSAMWGVAFVLLAFGLFRYLSPNVGRRRMENMAFVQLWSRVELWWASLRGKFRMRRAYVVFKCPHCKLKQRAPRGKGHIRVRCKQCGTSFDMRT